LDRDFLISSISGLHPKQVNSLFTLKRKNEEKELSSAQGNPPNRVKNNLETIRVYCLYKFFKIKKREFQQEMEETYTPSPKYGYDPISQLYGRGKSGRVEMKLFLLKAWVDLF